MLVIAGALALTALVAGVLTLEAVSAARDQRRAAERVLTDYAALGAEGVAGRLETFLAGRLYPVIAAAARTAGRLRTVGDLAADLTGGSREILDVVDRVFWLDSRGGTVRTTGVVFALASDSLIAVVTASSRRLSANGYFGAVWVTAGLHPELMVFQPLRGDRALGSAFTIPAAALAGVVTPRLKIDPVLPKSLLLRVGTEGGIGVRLTGASTELANRDFDPRSPYQARQVLDPMFADLAVEVSLSANLAPALVIGGLPRSRIPLLVGLLVLTVALSLAAGYQLRRERALTGLRDDFVASVSHELRTPLAQIRLFAETLRLGRIRSEAEGERSIGIIEREARRLEHLVGNILHFSRAERGLLQVEPELTDLPDLVRQIVADFVPLAERAGVTLQVAIATVSPVMADPAAIRQILLNLLDNAIKYGRGSQVIRVDLAADSVNVYLTVEDEGPGVPMAIRGRIWERFWRAEASRRAGVTGTGIGLAIVRELAVLHGGSVAVEDAAPSGARFIVTIPGSG